MLDYIIQNINLEVSFNFQMKNYSKLDDLFVVES